MSEKLEMPSWVDDESICPCGKKAGPDFRYGLCDEHANACPPVALLRWGQAMGRALADVAAAEERGRRRGVEEAAKIVEGKRRGGSRCDGHGAVGMTPSDSGERVAAMSPAKAHNMAINAPGTTRRAWATPSGYPPPSVAHIAPTAFRSGASYG